MDGAFRMALDEACPDVRMRLVVPTDGLWQGAALSACGRCAKRERDSMCCMQQLKRLRVFISANACEAAASIQCRHRRFERLHRFNAQCKRFNAQCKCISAGSPPQPSKASRRDRLSDPADLIADIHLLATRRQQRSPAPATQDRTSPLSSA